MITKFINGGEYEWDWVNFIDHKKYDNGILDKVLYFGWNTVCKDTNKIINNEKDLESFFFNFVAPCEIYQDDFLEIAKNHSFFDKVFLFCPYSPKIYNQHIDTKFIYHPHPLPSKYFDQYSMIEQHNKNFEVIYYGGIISNEHLNILKVMSKFKSVAISYHKRNYLKWPFFINYKHKIDLFEKWRYLSESKISITSNLLYLTDKQIEILKNNKDFNNYFPHNDYIIKSGLMPQLKSRVFEGAATKTLMLVKKDKWNLVEDWFIENEDFIYWENFNDLQEKIFEISNNYSKYWNIVLSAHSKVKKYYFESLMSNYFNV